MMEEEDTVLQPSKSSIGLVTPDNTPINYTFLQPQQQKGHEGYGFFRSAYEDFKEWNPVTNIGSAAYSWAKEYAMSFSDAPEGWDAFNEKAFVGVPLDIYNVMRLSEAKNPDQQDYIRMQITQELKNKEYLENGSWTGRAIGGIGGFVTGGWAIGATGAGLRAAGMATAADVMYGIQQLTTASTFKSLKPAEGFAKNFAKTLPGMYGEAAIYSGVRAITHETIGLEDWWNETWQSALFGSVIGGGIGTKASLALRKRLKVLDYHWDDINWRAEAAEDGSFGRWVAEGASESVGAARVSQAQKFVDEGIDQLGESPWFKRVFGLSPVVEGLTSKFTAVREWTGAMYDKGGILVGKSATAEGMQTAEQWMKGYRKQAMNVERQVNDLWAEQIGMTGPIKDTRAWLRSQLDSGNLMMRTEFYDHVSYALRNRDLHDIPTVQRAAGLIRKHYENLYQEAVNLKLLRPDLDPITASTYLNRVHNKIKMRAEEPEWIKSVVDSLYQMSDIRRDEILPVLRAAQELRHNLNVELRGLQRGTPEYTIVSRELRDARRAVREEQANIDGAIMAGQIENIHVIERPQFTERELRALNSVREPILARERPFQNDIRTARRNVRHAGEELSVARRAGRDAEDIAEMQANVDTLEARLVAARANLAELRDTIQGELDALIQSESLSDRFYKRNQQGFIRLIDPDAVPRLRPILQRPQEVPGGTPVNIYRGGEAYQIAKRSYDTILQQNPEQMVASVFDEMSGGGGGNNPLMARTLMIPDNVLQPWLNNDVTELMQLYTGFMSRKIGAEKALRQFSTDGRGAVADFTQRAKIQYDEMRQNLFDRPNTPERARSLKQLDKEFEDAKEFFKKSWGVYQGNYAQDFPEKWRPFFENLRNWTAATGLGALPLLQIQDMGNIIRQFGFGPFLQESVFPMITSLFQGGGLHYAREDLAHADLAITTALRAHSDNLTGSGSEYWKQGTFSRTLATMANKLGNISGSNQITDFFQHSTGILSQAKTIESLRKYVKGDKLTKPELERLHILGINKELNAHKILAQFDEFSTPVNLGSYEGRLANYERWTDFETQQIFLNSIGKEVDMVLVKPNLLDTPFAFKNPIIGSMMMFWSYPFASTNARVIPLLQRPDGQKILSEAFIMSMAAWVNPLREALSGREADVSSKALMASALTNSGIFGYPLEVFNRINSILDIPGLNEFKSDRFKGKGALSIMGGAPGSALDSGVSLANAIMNGVATGKVSESDARRLIKSLPFTSVWWGRYHVNAFIESMDLPKTRREAEGWFGE